MFYDKNNKGKKDKKKNVTSIIKDIDFIFLLKKKKVRN